MKKFFYFFLWIFLLLSHASFANELDEELIDKKFNNKFILENKTDDLFSNKVN